MASNRQIKYDQTFLDQAALVQPDAKRLDALLDGVIWLLSTHAEDCEIVERNLRVAFTDPFPDSPAMRIFFTITDDNNCTLHWIEHLPGDESEDYF